MDIPFILSIVALLLSIFAVFKVMTSVSVLSARVERLRDKCSILESRVNDVNGNVGRNPANRNPRQPNTERDSDRGRREKDSVNPRQQQPKQQREQREPREPREPQANQRLPREPREPRQPQQPGAADQQQPKKKKENRRRNEPSDRTGTEQEQPGRAEQQPRGDQPARGEQQGRNENRNRNEQRPRNEQQPQQPRNEESGRGEQQNRNENPRRQEQPKRDEPSASIRSVEFDLDELEQQSQPAQPVQQEQELPDRMYAIIPEDGAIRQHQLQVRPDSDSYLEVDMPSYSKSSVTRYRFNLAGNHAFVIAQGIDRLENAFSFEKPSNRKVNEVVLLQDGLLARTENGWKIQEKAKIDFR